MSNLSKIITPRFFIYKENTGKVISFRWLKTGFDLVIKNKTIFIQYGKRPIKFMYYAPASSQLPLFLISAGWATTFRLKGFRIGHTRKPLDLMKAWRMQCLRDMEQRTTGTMIKKISYGRH